MNVQLTLGVRLHREALCPCCSVPLHARGWTTIEGIAVCRACADLATSMCEGRLIEAAKQQTPCPCWVREHGLRFFCPRIIDRSIATSWMYELIYGEAESQRAGQQLTAKEHADRTWELEQRMHAAEKLMEELNDPDTDHPLADRDW